MKLLPLKITAKSGAWRKFYNRKANPKFKGISAAILKRDKYTCRFCGFHSKEHQEIVNIDSDYDNNKLNNLATACSFCAQCFFLDSLGLDENSGGSIVYAPEVSQADLNNFCRVLFCSMEKNSPYKGKLQSIYVTLKNRIGPIENCFGPNSSNPNNFGRGLIDSYLNEKQLNHKLLDSLRLLPAKSSFQPQINYWKDTIFSNISF